MSENDAIKVLRRRHDYLMGRLTDPGISENKRHFLTGDMSAIETALDALAEKLANTRAIREARYAASLHLPEASC